MATNLPIADKTTLDAVKALVGTASPAAGDLTTLFKGLKLIADYVDTLESSVNSLVSTLVTTPAYQKPRGAPVLSSLAVTSASLQTAVNYSGKGRLVALMAINGSTQLSSWPLIRLTIDGTVVAYGKAGLSASSTYTPDTFFLGTTDGSTIIMQVIGGSSQTAFQGIDFKTSLKVEYSSDGSHTSTIYALYLVE